jgi:hypothetical protein
MINPLEHSADFCTPTLPLETSAFFHKLYLCISYVSQNKQQIFPQTVLTV